MKLIIDIPNDLYDKYKNDNNIDNIHKWNILSFIRKGIPLDKIREDLHTTAELHDDGDYYLRDKWIDEIFDIYKAGIKPQESEG